MPAAGLIPDLRIVFIKLASRRWGLYTKCFEYQSSGISKSVRNFVHVGFV